MPTPALAHWRSTSRTEISHLLDTYLGVRLLDPGSAPVAEQLLCAVVVQLAGCFQRYCRDLHDFAVGAIVAAAPETYRSSLRAGLLADRLLDRRYATSAVLTHDFGRFQLELWPAPAESMLDEIMVASTAIALQDDSRLSHLQLDLPVFRAWWSALDDLAGALDAAVTARLESLIPWDQHTGAA